MKFTLSALKMAKIGCCRSAEAVPFVVESSSSDDEPPKQNYCRASPQCRPTRPVATTSSMSMTASATSTNGGEEEGVSSANNDALIDVYPLALGFLSPGEVARLLPLCRALHDVGREALPSVIANDLRPILPVGLVKSIDDGINKNDHWMKLAKEWRCKSFVRADADDDSGTGAEDDDSSSVVLVPAIPRTVVVWRIPIIYSKHSLPSRRYRNFSCRIAIPPSSSRIYVALMMKDMPVSEVFGTHCAGLGTTMK